MSTNKITPHLLLLASVWRTILFEETSYIPIACASGEEGNERAGSCRGQSTCACRMHVSSRPPWQPHEERIAGREATFLCGPGTNTRKSGWRKGWALTAYKEVDVVLGGGVGPGNTYKIRREGGPEYGRRSEAILTNHSSYRLKHSLHNLTKNSPRGPTLGSRSLRLPQGPEWKLAYSRFALNASWLTDLVQKASDCMAMRIPFKQSFQNSHITPKLV